jgi:hypothetical protein
MKHGRKRRLAKFFSLPVLALCGFMIAATLAGVGLATDSSTTDTSSTISTTTPPPPPPPPTGNEGCTPGYWKNHLDAWVGYSPDQTVNSVFTGALPSVGTSTLQQALSFGGGPGVLGAEQILLRAAVAALLNAANPDVDYALTTAEVIADVNAALASGDRDTILELATELDALNNGAGGCPLS